MSGHTPGPWSFDGPSDNHIIWSADGCRVAFMAHSAGVDPKRDTATAALVATAPELLEIALEANNALNSMAAQVDAEMRDHDKAAARHDAVVREFRAKVRAAIAKAQPPAKDS